MYKSCFSSKNGSSNHLFIYSFSMLRGEILILAQAADISSSRSPPFRYMTPLDTPPHTPGSIFFHIHGRKSFSSVTALETMKSYLEDRSSALVCSATILDIPAAFATSFTTNIFSLSSHKGETRFQETLWQAGFPENHLLSPHPGLLPRQGTL